MIPARELAIYVFVAAFIALFLTSGVTNGPSRAWNAFSDGFEDSLRYIGKSRFPDFSRYPPLKVLSPSEFPLDSDTRRVIVVGDIHGMIDPFHKLLDKVGYNSSADVLVHTGDFIAKGRHSDSMSVLSFMTRNNITGVRGNHDEMVIEWAGWIRWISRTREGRNWLRRVEQDWKDEHRHDKSLSLDDFLDSEKKKCGQSLQDRRWWKLIPQDWQLLGDHYRIARDMSEDQYQYMVQLPTRIYVPSAHTFIVHAGLLPLDPRVSRHDRRQPLSRIPKDSDKFDSLLGLSDVPRIERLRAMQEMAVLTNIPQNTRPWVVQNLRVIKNRKPSRKSDGKYWYNVWRKELDRCVGYPGDTTLAVQLGLRRGDLGKRGLPCYPATIVYGHMAAKGLNIRRWTVGLDSGCVYGRKLSALVLGGPKLDSVDHTSDKDDLDAPSDQDEGEEEEETLDRGKHQSGDIFPFGDRYEGQVITVDCHRRS